MYILKLFYSSEPVSLFLADIYKECTSDFSNMKIISVMVVYTITVLGTLFKKKKLYDIIILQQEKN